MSIGIQQKTKTINGHAYEVTQLTADKGSLVFVRLMRMLGPAFTSEAGLSSLFNSIKDEDFSYLVNAFRPSSFVDGKHLERDEIYKLHFAGNYKELIQWLLFCLEVNFADFFPEKSKLEKAAQAAGVDLNL